MRVAGDGALECRFGLNRHHAVRGGGLGFAEVGFARRALAVELQRFLSRFDRIVEAAKPHIDRGEHFPAWAIAGILRQVRLDLADECDDRLIALGGTDAGERRLARKVRRAERDIGEAAPNGKTTKAA